MLHNKVILFTAVVELRRLVQLLPIVLSALIKCLALRRGKVMPSAIIERGYDDVVPILLGLTRLLSVVKRMNHGDLGEGVRRLCHRVLELLLFGRWMLLLLTA